MPMEGLGRWAKPGLFRRAPRIERVGAAWRLGVLLVTADAGLLAVGEVVRAAPEARRGFTAESAKERAEHRAAAVRGGFAPGDIVHIDWTAIDLDAVEAGGESGPVRAGADGPQVRWSAAGGWVDLATYLRERVALLLDPPAGA